MPRLTVLICTHNRAGLLEHTLATLNAAKRPVDWQVDILVAANACGDGTHDLLDGYRRDQTQREWLPLTWFAEPTPGKSNALNSAAPRLACDLVAFVDDDHRVDADYLVQVCRTADAHPEADMFCGRILPDWDGSEPAWVHDTGPYRIYPLPVPRFDLGPKPKALGLDTAIPGGGNLVVRSGVFAIVGPFATDFGPTGHDLGGAEDLEWVRRALQAGVRLRYAPGIAQYHYVDTGRLTLKYLMRKAYKRSASTMRLFPEQLVDALIPPYMVRKTVSYLGMALVGFKRERTRHYLVRFASALGEIQGHLQARRDLRVKGNTDST